jgi:hypothetical protein
LVVRHDDIHPLILADIARAYAQRGLYPARLAGVGQMTVISKATAIPRDTSMKR